MNFELRFIDNFEFMQTSLVNIASNLEKDKFADKLHNINLKIPCKIIGCIQNGTRSDEICDEHS